MDTSPSRSEDTTFYRIARDVGFNARVEPLWYTFQRLQNRMGFFEKRREKRRIQKLIDGVRKEIPSAPEGWENRAGKCVCNLRVAKIGLLAELRSHLKERLEADVARRWPHLNGYRDRNSLLLPFDFPQPLQLPSGSGEETIPVASATRLGQELRDVNQALNIDETFALAKVSRIDYVDATDRDIAIYESRFNSLDGFWAKFAYVLLKKLADMSLERQFPAIFA